MQNHTGSTDLEETVFFTSELEGSHVYLVSGYMTVTGTGDGVDVHIFRNGQNIQTIGGEQGDYIFAAEEAILSQGDELSFSVDVTGTFAWSLELRLVRMLDELAPLE